MNEENPTGMNRLSVGEFIELLQMEFISRKMRSIFYDDPKAKAANADIAEKKKEKIMDMAKKMGCLTIFDREQLLEEMFYKKFLNPYGLPNLTYGNKSESVRWYDKRSFIKRGHWVSFRGKSCKVIDNDAEMEEVCITYDKQKVHVPYNFVTLLTLEEFDCDDLLK